MVCRAHVGIAGVRPSAGLQPRRRACHKASKAWTLPNHPAPQPNIAEYWLENARTCTRSRAGYITHLVPEAHRLTAHHASQGRLGPATRGGLRVSGGTSRELGNLLWRLLPSPVTSHRVQARIKCMGLGGIVEKSKQYDDRKHDHKITMQGS